MNVREKLSLFEHRQSSNSTSSPQELDLLARSTKKIKPSDLPPDSTMGEAPVGDSSSTLVASSDAQMTDPVPSSTSSVPAQKGLTTWMKILTWMKIQMILHPLSCFLRLKRSA
ncbi:hypothetical protein SLEP1_g16584 [Rubroshorea leprosula]|uniref:Uncharacterized protein n=1 Tax=Rubroshorea leprosula TaxID=152421 RepID=A0AAV5IRE4_9ROSI|nr:hypothetical protein SLEP1_g16584 [Rubroshorea leprosula]